MLHRMQLRPAALDTDTADIAAAFKAHIFIIIITILQILRVDVEPPISTLQMLDSTAGQHVVRDHLPDF